MYTHTYTYYIIYMFLVIRMSFGIWMYFWTELVMNIFSINSQRVLRRCIFITDEFQNYLLIIVILLITTVRIIILIFDNY